MSKPKKPIVKMCPCCMQLREVKILGRKGYCPICSKTLYHLTAQQKNKENIKRFPKWN